MPAPPAGRVYRAAWEDTCGFGRERRFDDPLLTDSRGRQARLAEFSPISLFTKVRKTVSIVILVGSATTPGRTHTIAAQLGDSLRARDANLKIDLLDLAQVSFAACDGRPLEAYDVTVRDAVSKVAAAAGIVIASPVYRATYTGVLKNFLDILPVVALRDKLVGIAVVGASLHHYLGVDTGLRSVLAWFGALALPTSVYLTSSDFDEAKQPTACAREQLDALAESLLRLTREVSSGHFGPEPLAARANRG